MDDRLGRAEMKPKGVGEDKPNNKKAKLFGYLIKNCHDRETKCGVRQRGGTMTDKGEPDGDLECTHTLPADVH